MNLKRLKIMASLAALLGVACQVMAQGTEPDPKAELLDRLRAIRDAAPGADERGGDFGELRGTWFVDDPGFADNTSFEDMTFDFEGRAFVAGREEIVDDNFEGFVFAYPVTNDEKQGAPARLWRTSFGQTNSFFIKRLESDQDGFLYAAGDGRPVLSLSFKWARIAKLSPGGGVIWDRIFTTSGASNLYVDMELAPDGAPIIATRDRVVRLNPFTGVTEWKVDYSSAIPRGIEIDDEGDVYVLTEEPDAGVQRLRVTKIKGDSGRTDNGGWVQLSAAFSTASEFNSGGVFIEMDPSSGNVFVLGDRNPASGDGHTMYALDRDTGALINGNAETTPNLDYEQLVVDNLGRPSVLKTVTDASHSLIERYTHDAAGKFWSGQLDGVNGRLALDRFNDIYALLEVPAGSDDRYYRIFGDDKAFTVFWRKTYDDATCETEIKDLVIDRSGKVFGLTAKRDLCAPGDHFDDRLRQIIQFYETKPTIQCAAFEVSLENQSVWAPGTGQLLATGDIWNPSWDVEFPLGIDLLIASGGLEFQTDGNIDIDYRAELDGGTLDIHLPFDAQWLIPRSRDLLPNQLYTITPLFDIEPGARMTTCVAPELNAGLYTRVQSQFMADFVLSVFGEDIANEDLFGFEFNYGPGYVPYANLADIIGIPRPGEWVEFEDPTGSINVRARIPALTSRGPFVPGLMSDGSFNTTANELFFVGTVNVTNIIEEIIETANPGLDLPISMEIDLSNEDIDEDLVGTIGYALVQAKIILNTYMQQDIDVDVQMMCRYEANEAIFPGGQTSITLPLGDPLDFVMPSDNDVCITPHVFADLHFTNTTSAILDPQIGLDLITVGAGISYADIELISVDESLEIMFPDLGLDVELDVFPEFSWTIRTQEFEVAPLVVAGDPVSKIKPLLDSASRASMDFYIYNQAEALTDRTLIDFNVATVSSTRMLLYGDRFISGTKAVVSHHGAEEELSTTILNSTTLLVELPNRFKVLPGVAKIWVESSLGTSSALDLPIEYPTPKLATVNPNLWAADPDLAVVPAQVIDGKTVTGADSFIARRDYYVVLRDVLWSDLTAGGITADAYFPAFRFNQIPALPAVLFDGQPQPRFTQPVDSGIHNIRVAEPDYNRPKFITVEVCNPAPGGGISEERVLTIAAPPPIISSIDPSEIEPGGNLDPGKDFVRIVVRGPRHVPTFNGFQEPKSGNFNADSIVMFDGASVPTQFINSSELHAEVPVWLIQHPTNALITVYTPSNGTFYFEQEVILDPDTGEIISDEPEFVESGGESPPLLFRVRFRQPQIEILNPPCVAVGTGAFDPASPGEDQYNFAVIGRDFREGAQVLVDGAPRDTVVVSRGLLRAKLLPSDATHPGQRAVQVLNPGTSNAISEPAYLAVN